MAAPYLDLSSKVEAAFKSVVDALSLLDSADASVPCFTGIEDEANATPCVTVVADENGEALDDTGNSTVSVSVKVWTRVGGDAGETLAQHRTRCATVFDAILRDDIATTLSAAVDDFYVFDASKTGGGKGNGPASLMNEITLDVVCCASDLT